MTYTVSDFVNGKPFETARQPRTETSTMNAFQIVTIVRALLDSDQTIEQIAATLQAMGVGGQTPRTALQPVATVANAPQPTGNGAANNMPITARVAAGQAGIQPMVKYTLAPGWTLQTAFDRLGNAIRLREVVQHIAQFPDGITKRDLRAQLGHASPGVTMSAIHGLQQRGIVQSVGIPGAQPSALPNANAALHAAAQPAVERRRSAKRPANGRRAAATVTVRRKR